MNVQQESNTSPEINCNLDSRPPAPADDGFGCVLHPDPSLCKAASRLSLKWLE